MKNDLESLLSNPFESKDPSSTATDPEAQKKTLISIAEHAGDITSRTIHNFALFRHEIELVMRPHVSSLNSIKNQLFVEDLPPEILKAVSSYRDEFQSKSEEINNFYRIYIVTAADSILAKEAERYKRRYFRETANQNQLNFIKMKRYYEKVKTFNEQVRDKWRSIEKIIFSLSVVSATRSIMEEIENDHLKSITLLMRQSDVFLDALYNYLCAEEETYDRISGSHRIVIAYNPKIRYNLAGFFGDPEPEIETTSSEAEAEQSSEADEQINDSYSIAKNIVLHSKKRRLNRADTISVKLLGSRDWNLSPHYNMEIPVAYFEESLNNLNKSYQVNIHPNTTNSSVLSSEIEEKENKTQNKSIEYRNMIHTILDKIIEDITKIDFPGLEKPLVFIYHCGPETTYEILIATFNHLRIGEIFYLNEANNTVQEFPEEIIRKELIEWWNNKMTEISTEEVDSYLTFSHAIEMVKKEYRSLYEEGTNLRKKELHGATYLGLDKWMKQNRTRLFGMRKLIIFKRFLSLEILR